MNKSQTYNRATDLMYNNLEDYVTFFRIFDATLFFYKYLGVELSWKFSPQNGDWKPGLDNEISTMYPDFYKDYPSLTFDDMKQQNIMFGLNSKIKLANIFIYPRFLVGGTVLAENEAAYELKAKNSNQTYVVSYLQNTSNKFSFTYNAGFSLVYFFLNNVGVNFDFDYYQFYNKMNYEITNTNMVTMEKTKEIFNYSGTKRYFSIGIGLNYFVSFQRSKKKVK